MSGINLFAYSANNPINMLDPLGLDFIHIRGGWGVYITDNNTFVHFPLRSGMPLVTDPSIEGQGPTPPGVYFIIDPPVNVEPGWPKRSSYCDKAGNCWFVPYYPVLIDHPNRCRYILGERCGMHPEGGSEGTEGCSGLLLYNSSMIRDMIREYNPSPDNPIPVVIEAP